MKKIGTAMVCALALGIAFALLLGRSSRRHLPVWTYNYVDTGGATTLDTTGVKIIFQGRSNQTDPAAKHTANGVLAVAGPLYLEDSGPAKPIYSNGVCTMTLYGHSVQLSNAGRVLLLDGQSFDLSDKKLTVIVETNGPAHLGLDHSNE